MVRVTVLYLSPSTCLEQRIFVNVDIGTVVVVRQVAVRQLVMIPRVTYKPFTRLSDNTAHTTHATLIRLSKYDRIALAILTSVADPISFTAR